MTEPDERWKLDPDMPRLFLLVYDDGTEVKWGGNFRSSYEITKHLDSKMEEAKLRGLVLEVALRYVSPEEAGYQPEIPEVQLGKLEDELSAAPKRKKE